MFKSIHGIALTYLSDRVVMNFDVNGIRNQEIFIFDTTKAFGQVNSTCLQKNILPIEVIKAIHHDNQVEKTKTKYT